MLIRKLSLFSTYSQIRFLEEAVDVENLNNSILDKLISLIATDNKVLLETADNVRKEISDLKSKQNQLPKWRLATIYIYKEILKANLADVKDFDSIYSEVAQIPQLPTMPVSDSMDGIPEELMEFIERRIPSSILGTLPGDTKREKVLYDILH